jgi:hypothetical protein
MQPSNLIRILSTGLISLIIFVQANAWAYHAPLNPGCITSGEQWVLIGTLPAPVTATTASDGACSGNYQYQWQVSYDNINFIDLPGATGKDLSFTTPPAQTAWYQRKATCGAEVGYTGTVKINMTATLYYNVAVSGTFARNNCVDGGIGGAITYTVPANTYLSAVSQAEANAKAQAQVNAMGQAYANSNATCTWYNAEKSGSFTRNNCVDGGIGGAIIYTVPAYTYLSLISHADANAKAQAQVNAMGQAYANSNAVCTWYNVPKEGSFTRDNCPFGTLPTIAYYTVPAGTYSSTVSQTEADQKAQDDVYANGQTYANDHGSCIPTDTVPPNTYLSPISQADADAKAQAAINAGGQAYANSNAVCTWYNVPKNGPFTRNNCPFGTHGTSTFIRYLAVLIHPPFHKQRLIKKHRTM